MQILRQKCQTLLQTIIILIKSKKQVSYREDMKKETPKEMFRKEKNRHMGDGGNGGCMKVSAQRVCVSPCVSMCVSVCAL